MWVLTGTFTVFIISSVIITTSETAEKLVECLELNSDVSTSY